MHQARRFRPFVSRFLPLFPALFAAHVAAAPLAAQSMVPPGTAVEGYFARAVLDPAVAGSRTRVAGVGARLLIPVQSLTDGTLTGPARRTSIGAFFTTIPDDGRGVEARHFGIQADLRPTEAPVVGRVEPLLSVGVGSFVGRRQRSVRELYSPICLGVTDFAVPEAAQPCLRALPGHGDTTRNQLAVSPAVGVRVGLLPGLALRAELRDVIVQRDGPRHNVEIATGLSFLR